MTKINKFTYGDGSKVPDSVINKLNIIGKDGMPRIDKKYKNISFYNDLKEYFNTVFREEISTHEKKNKIQFGLKSFDIVHALNYEVYQNECTQLSIFGAFLRFGSRGNKIDISRVEVDENFREKGLGTHIMTMFLVAVYETIVKYQKKNKKIPDIILECSGSVGIGKNKLETPVHSQVKFFLKFGFLPYEINGGYIKMKLNSELFLNFMMKLADKHASAA